jgi:GT2 family glycosyltransferase/glycosyltransferase involved in cell wall biosynthesis
MDLNIWDTGPPEEQLTENDRVNSTKPDDSTEEGKAGTRQNSIVTLSRELSEQRQMAESLRAEGAEWQRKVQGLEAKIAEKDHLLRTLWSHVYSTQAELGRIRGSIGWRLLSRYGVIKHGYLLPIYRMLGLNPRKSQESSSSGDGRPGSGKVNLERRRTSPPTKDFAEKFLETNRYDLICFPIIDWDFRFQRPQQLMLRFAAAGHRVFYVAQEFRLSGQLYSLKEKGKNIFEVSLRAPKQNIYSEALDPVVRDILFDSLDALRCDLSMGATASMVQLPFWWPLAEKIRRRFAWPVIYDCMDYHPGFSTNRPEMLEQEPELLSGADCVTVSSAFLEKEAQKHSSRVVLLPNACDYNHFANAGKSKGPRPVIGYYGAIAHWFDSDLVADLAERNPQWDFVLVGSTFTADIRRLSKLPNVTLAGEQPYTKIPKWLGKFDVALLPRKRNSLTEAMNPVKAYEILASGKPFVTVPIPEMVSMAPLVRLASTPEEFEAQIAAALDERDPDLVERRRSFARDNTWEKRFEKLEPSVRETFPKASIIIVTYNNFALTRLCLTSLFARTDWPNYEVIVLDNGSSDGTRDYLREAESTFPHLQVILNEDNSGFAAATNVGLKLAKGEYIAFLNNDTVLTRGWLSALIRHLKADTTLGLVGPVTNATGNEARIDVGYKRIEDMSGWAASCVRKNDGRLFPIPMLALFCAAMRRDVFERVGLLDERFGIGMFEDDDFTHRIRNLGLKICCARDSFVHHWMKASFNLLDQEEYQILFDTNRKKYEEKWGEPWIAHCSEPYREEPETADRGEND